MTRDQRLANLWEKCQLLDIQARRSRKRVDRDLAWSARWENGQRDGMLEGDEYAAQDRCVRLANEVLRLREEQGQRFQAPLTAADVFGVHDRLTQLVGADMPVEIVKEKP